jgi:hypothetical protein
MRCNELKHFQDKVDAAVHAIRAAKSPLKFVELAILRAKLAVAREAWANHRNTCLICANEKD